MADRFQSVENWWWDTQRARAIERGEPDPGPLYRDTQYQQEQSEEGCPDCDGLGLMMSLFDEPDPCPRCSPELYALLLPGGDPDGD